MTNEKTRFGILNLSNNSNTTVSRVTSTKSKINKSLDDETADALSAILSNNDESIQQPNQQQPQQQHTNKKNNRNSNNIRLISVSRKHAFPPSKDPIGNNNTVSQWIRSVISNNNEY